MGKFCPFINGECRTDCVFRRRKVSSENGVTECQLVATSSSSEYLSDILIKKEENAANKKQ